MSDPKMSNRDYTLRILYHNEFSGEICEITQERRFQTPDGCIENIMKRGYIEHEQENKNFIVVPWHSITCISIEYKNNSEEHKQKQIVQAREKLSETMTVREVFAKDILCALLHKKPRSLLDQREYLDDAVHFADLLIGKLKENMEQ